MADSIKNNGGHRYSLSDETRLKDSMMEFISKDYHKGITAEELKNEDLKIKLDNYLGQHDVPNRRKQLALKELVKEKKLVQSLKTGTKVFKPYEEIAPLVPEVRNI
jgi:hypothetical protein